MFFSAISLRAVQAKVTNTNLSYIDVKNIKNRLEVLPNKST